ncbi:MAG: phospholipid carrier-dependent glycosyltransferase [Candidatus Caldarchaeum sp.]
MTIQDILGRTYGKAGFHRTVALSVFLILFLLRLQVINTPSPSTAVENCIEPTGGSFPTECGFVFDEAHYIPAVRKMLRGEAVNNEHPPLSKALIALSMLAFGDNPLGWRFAPAVLSSASVALTPLIARHFTGRRELALAATILTATDVMYFNIGSIAMLDGPALFFLLAGTLLFLQKRHVTAAIFLGLAFLSKTATLFSVAGLLAYIFIQSYSRKRRLVEAVYEWSPVFEKTTLIVLAVAIGGLAVYDYTFKAFNTPFAHLDYILSYHSQLRYSCKEFELPLRCTVVEADGRRTVVDLPLSWISPISPFAAAPYHIVTVTAGDRSWHPVAYWGIYSPVWWTTALVAAYAAYFLIVSRGSDSLHTFVLAWIAFSYGPYLYLAHVLNRYVYTFYFLPTVPAIALGLPSVLAGDKFSKAVLYSVVFVQIAWFFIYFPVKSDPHIQILETLNLPR